jgi:tetratricopeptide (TPR) repeat protein
MTVKTVDLPTFTRELRRDLSSGKVAFLTGAGVSMLEPSSLPSGHELKDMAVAAICCTLELRNELRRVRVQPKYLGITPEIVFQRFDALLGVSSMLPFFNVLQHARPNRTHQLLGYLAQKHGCPIYTTNFDKLHEDSAGPRQKICHLHGVVTQPASLIARINQVGRGISPQVLARAKRDLKGRTLCILGYSGNDEDVRLAVGECGVTRILWLTRNSRDWAWKNIPTFSRSHHILVAAGDLRLFSASWGGSPGGLGPTDKLTKSARLRTISDWAARPRVIDRFACMSELLFEIEDYVGALRVSAKALRKARGTELAGWFRIQMTNALKVLGRFDEAERVARRALRINTRRGDLFDIAGAYNSLGVLLVEKASPEPKRALLALQRALANLESIDMRTCDRRRRERLTVLRGRVLNNLGLAHEWLGDFNTSRSFYHQALSVKTRIGDLLGEAKTAGNISIVETAMGDPVAVRSRERAILLMDKYDLRWDKAYLLRRTGLLRCRAGRHREGAKLLKQAMNLYKTIDGSTFDMALTSAALKTCR